MKLFRAKATVTLPGERTETYWAQFVTLFSSFKCASKEEKEFVDEARFLFYLNYIQPNNDLAHIELDDIDVKVTYKVIQFNPIKDLWNRFWTFIKYKF